ncbi:glycosyltransferase family 2 protein [Bifidobacterium magnum]|uniref:glycosyltransferase family 2 protein n=1 Tax=Bifidobacterium magnum TaxID=1692 RepID=UPI0009E049A5|nr:glycosyltransferase [Bifidobacterium magnum]
MNSSKIYDAVIVVYNHEIKDIPSLALLQKSDYINRIIICDNSTDAGIIRDNVETSESKVKIKYIQMHGNVGLSKAYNRAVSESTSDFIVILDDDTPLPEDFFQLSTDFILSHPSSDIYLPIVQSLHGTLSPCKKKWVAF